MRESVVEKHLRVSVHRAGGAVRKFVSPGRRGVTDRLVIWPGDILSVNSKHRHQADVHFVETKAPGKKAAAHQAREHVRLMALQCVVLVLDTKEKVDRYVAQQRKERHLP